MDPAVEWRICTDKETAEGQVELPQKIQGTATNCSSYKDSRIKYSYYFLKILVRIVLIKIKNNEDMFTRC